MKRQAKEESTDIVKTTIRVRRDLWNAVLHRSIDEETSSQQIVERALEAYLQRKEGRK
jgi:hypothetical protein